MTVGDSKNNHEMPHPMQLPPHPVERHQPLPGQNPKSSQDNAPALEIVQKILACASYRQADEDLDFFQGAETRGIRLQLDYLKTETLLQEHRVAHTIVVFGGTRILERGAAKRVVSDLEQ